MSTEKCFPREQDTPEPESLKEALRLLQEDAKLKGVDKMTMQEVIKEIAAYRREKREQTFDLS